MKPVASKSYSDLDREWYDGEYDVLSYKEVIKLKKEHKKTCKICR
jgi:hypothetical protein